uniref:Uncharacterized protein n=1 Tax=Glaukea argentea TaxID=2894057 RepID=A0A386B1H8_9CHLO|nr:hypothetical protein [Udotea argentea]AYC65561.1 hypothetical protein [Udotea argentea]
MNPTINNPNPNPNINIKESFKGSAFEFNFYDDSDKNVINRNLVFLAWLIFLYFVIFLIRYINSKFGENLNFYFNKIDFWMEQNKNNPCIQKIGYFLKYLILFSALYLKPEFADIAIQNLTINWSDFNRIKLKLLMGLISNLFFVYCESVLSIQIVSFCTIFIPNAPKTPLLIQIVGPFARPLIRFVEKFIKCVGISLLVGYVSKQIEDGKNFYSISLSFTGVLVIVSDCFLLKTLASCLIKVKLFDFLYCQLGRFAFIFSYAQLAYTIVLPRTFYTYIVCSVVFDVCALSYNATPNFLLNNHFLKF